MRGLLADALPALVALGLVQATEPALAQGQVPLCTRAGVRWIDPDGEMPAPKPANPCAHGWCQGNRPRPQKGR